MTDRPCGQHDCPVPAAPPARGLRTVVWPAGTRLRRGHRPEHGPADRLVPGRGDSRFAPLASDGADGPSAHTYVATTALAALLESALHRAAGTRPRVHVATLTRWVESAVVLRQDVRLVDLRDDQLQRLGLPREALVSTAAVHHRCTRAWARGLHGRAVGGRPTHGLVWHSRQLELQVRALDARPALRDVLADHPAEVAVLWSPPAAPDVLAPGDGGLGPLGQGPGLAYVADLAAWLGIPLL